MSEEIAIGPARAIRETLVTMVADSFWFQKLIGVDTSDASRAYIHTPHLRADGVKFDHPFCVVSRNEGSAVRFERQTAGPVPVYTASGELRVSLFDEADSPNLEQADADFSDFLDGLAQDLLEQSSYNTNVTIEYLSIEGPMESKFEEQPDLGPFWCGHIIVGWSNT